VAGPVVVDVAGIVEAAAATVDTVVEDEISFLAGFVDQMLPLGIPD
jgi:hypothetical protein